MKMLPTKLSGFILLVSAIAGFSIVSVFAQQNEIWQRTYGIPGRFDNIYSVKSIYDQGFILGLASTMNSYNEYLTWLIKTDVNGNILWSKALINSTKVFIIKSLDVNDNGNIIITGATEEYDNNGDVFLMRLNACGEKVWCKVIRYPNMNYGYRVKIRQDGNYALYTRYTAPQGYKADRLWIFDTVGNNISSFYVVPPGTHPNISDPLVEDFIITSDQGYLFSGSCYFPLDTLNPTIWRLQHMLVKVDSVGIIQWIRPHSIDSNHVGVLLSSAELDEVFYSVGYDYTAVKTEINAGYISDPYNGKFSFTGNLLFEKVLHPDTMFDFLKYIQPMSDGALIQAGVITHDSAGDPPYFMGLFKTDTMFSILGYLENDTGSVTNECITVSIDGKFLVTGYCPPESSYTEVDGLAIKVNSDLQYDSLYTFPFVYDSLCPFPILTDTIDCDCDVITGYGEPAETEERYTLQLFPNPAKEKVRVLFRDVTGGDESQNGKLILYDLFGRRIRTEDFRKEAEVDVSSLHTGIYLVAVEQKGQALARAKLVVL